MVFRPPKAPRIAAPRVSGPRVTAPRVGRGGVRGPRVTGPRVSGGGPLARLFRGRSGKRATGQPSGQATGQVPDESVGGSGSLRPTDGGAAPRSAPLAAPAALGDPAPRRGSRRSGPPVRQHEKGALTRSLHLLGEAQWGDAFDRTGLDGRFLPAFDQQQRILVTVTLPDGRTQRVVGIPAVTGFDPAGDAISGKGAVRLDQRPVFHLQRAGRRPPVALDSTTVIEAIEHRDGRFRWTGAARLQRAGADQ